MVMFFAGLLVRLSDFAMAVWLWPLLLLTISLGLSDGDSIIFQLLATSFHLLVRRSTSRQWAAICLVLHILYLATATASFSAGSTSAYAHTQRIALILRKVEIEIVYERKNEEEGL